MNAIDLTTNFNKAASLHAASELFAKKRAKLGPGKAVTIGEIYDGFLKTVAVPVESKDPSAVYNDILNSHNMVTYFPNIQKGSATGAKKLRVGEVVTTAAKKFSEAVSIEYPVTVEVHAPKEVTKPIVKEETVVAKPAEEKPVAEMTRTRRHEENNYVETPVSHPEPVVPMVDEASSRRLDSYLSSGGVTSQSSIEDQKMDKLAKKLSEIAALNRKTTDLQSQANDLLAQEQAMDAKINAALRKADDDYISATQSLDEVAEKISETQERLRRKQELLERLNGGGL